MNCPVCDKKLKVCRTAQTKGRMIRVLKCNYCSRKFVTEEFAYPIISEKAQLLKSEADHLNYEKQKLQAIIPEHFSKPPVKPKEKRKVAPKPKQVQQGEVYLTYGEIFEKFKEKDPFHGEAISDYRPYSLLDHSIIVWFKKGRIYKEDVERAYQYNPETDEFTRIENAKTYEEILADVKGKLA